MHVLTREQLHPRKQLHRCKHARLLVGWLAGSWAMQRTWGVSHPGRFWCAHMHVVGAICSFRSVGSRATAGEWEACVYMYAMDVWMYVCMYVCMYV